MVEQREPHQDATSWSSPCTRKRARWRSRARPRGQQRQRSPRRRPAPPRRSASPRRWSRPSPGPSPRAPAPRADLSHRPRRRRRAPAARRRRQQQLTARACERDALPQCVRSPARVCTWRASAGDGPAGPSATGRDHATVGPRSAVPQSAVRTAPLTAEGHSETHRHKRDGTDLNTSRPSQR